MHSLSLLGLFVVRRGDQSVIVAASLSPMEMAMAFPSSRIMSVSHPIHSHHISNIKNRNNVRSIINSIPGSIVVSSHRSSSPLERLTPFSISKRGVSFTKFTTSLGFRKEVTTSASPNDHNTTEEEDASSTASSNDRGLGKRVEEFGEALSSGFPLWVAAACAAGMIRPTAFTWIQGSVQIIGLSITMLGMGMTISLEDFRGAIAMPRELLAGVVLQYTVMPTAGALVSKAFNLPASYAAGLCLVACCPGGTASNVVTYLARGNVALSVLMTAASTFLAVVMTPMLTAKLVGQYVAVDAKSLFGSTVQVVLLPVIAGALLAHYLPGLVRRISPLAPSVAVITVAAICAGAISQSAATIRVSGLQVLVAVVALHSAGFFFGYIMSKLLGFEESTSRTISIEVGMQNSVLGVVLASQHFASPLTAVPCAVSSICHSIIGSALARFWRSREAAGDGI